MHYLTFGTVVSINGIDDSVLLMIVDWNCIDVDGNRWDYVSVPCPLGWTLLKNTSEELSLTNFTDSVFFNHEDIEKIFFVGPPNEKYLKLEQAAFKNAKENDLPIARYYLEEDAQEIKASFESIDRDKPYIKLSGNDDVDVYLPIGTVCTLDISGDKEEKVDLQNVMIVAYYR